MVYRIAAFLLLIGPVILAAEPPMPPETIRATFHQAFDANIPNQRRQSMVEQLIAQGPATAEVIGKDVNDRLLAGRRGGRDTESLLRLAASFGDGGAVVVPALTQLASGQDTYVTAAIQALGKIGSPAKGAVPTLVGLNIRDQGTFVTVATTLGRIGGPDAEKALHSWTRDPKPVRAAAAKLALAQLDPKAMAGLRKEAIDTLVSETREGDTSRRGQARLLIANLDAADALAFAPLLSDAKAKYGAVHAIYAIHTGEANEHGGGRKPFGPPALNRLAELSDADRKALTTTEKPLAEIASSNEWGKGPAMELLGVLFKDSAAGVDVMIANFRSCSDINDPPIQAIVHVGKKALPKLLERYKSLPPRARERGWVLAAIARIDPASVPDPNEFMQEPMLPATTMSQILALMGDRGINFMLDQVYPNGQRNKGVRVVLGHLPKGEATIRAIMPRFATADQLQASEYARALLNAARPEDLPLLLKEFTKIHGDKRRELGGVMAVLLRDNPPVQKRLMTDPDAGIRRIAAESYSNRPLDADAVDTLLTVWANEPDEDVRKAIIRSIQSYGGKAAIADLIKRIDTLPEARQAEAVPLMGQMTARKAGQLEPLLASKSATVRAAAVGELAGERFSDHLWPSAAVEKLALDPSPDVRAALARTLLTRDGKTFPPLVFKMLGDTDATVRLAAAQAALSMRFNHLKPADAPPEIIALLKDPDPRVRAVVRRSDVFSLANVVSPFKEMLAGDKWQQCSALEVLARGASPELQSAVLQLMKSPDALVRSYAAGAAGGFPLTVESATTVAQLALGDTDPTVRWAALRSLDVLRRKLPTEQKMVEITIPARPVRATSRPAVEPPLPQKRMIQMAVPVPLKFDLKATDDATVLARAFVGEATDATAGALFDWLGGADDRKAVAATRVMAVWATNRNVAKKLSAEWPKRPPLARAMYGALVYRPYNPQAAGDWVGASSADQDLQEISSGSDRAATIAKFATVSTPQQLAAPVDIPALLKDSNALVRVLAIRTFTRSRSADLERRKDVRDIIYKALEDPDLHVVTAASEVASSNSLFGDGSVRADIPAGVLEACTELGLRLAGCEPGERPALVKDSLTAAGDSPYMVVAWINMLHDYDPAVRALAAQGLHRYGDLWLEMRSPQRTLPPSRD